MRSFHWKVAPLALVLALAAGCQDLEVVNPNQPDRERALDNPGDVLTLLTGAYRGAHEAMFDDGNIYLALPLVADEGTGTYANAGALEMSSEPRIPYNNNPTSESSGMARALWENFYGVIADANDVVGAIEGGLDLTVDGVDYNETSRLWGYFLQGLAHSYIGMFFDKAFVYTDEDLDKGVSDLELMPYNEVMASGIALFDKAIAYADAHPDVVIPDGWMGPMGDLTTSDVKKLANFFVARTMVYGARTPAEREAVDWAEVLRRLDASYATDKIMHMDNTYRHEVHAYAVYEDTFNFWADNKLIGPADTSGNYQEWLATPFADRDRFLIWTPDRRFPETNADNEQGKYFQHDITQIFRPERGMYHMSAYQYEGRGTGPGARMPDTGESDGNKYRRMDYPYVNIDEINLLKAEAHYFLGDMAKAAEFTNISRVEWGELPPLTAAGVPGTVGTCVPMKSTVTPTCGDLYDAIMYERMIQIFLQDATRSYLDSRGFGRLSEGTFEQLPIPGRELGTLGLELYSFGGVGGPSGAANVR